MQYRVTSPQSTVERIDNTDNPQRAAARYVWKVWGPGDKRRTVHVQVGLDLPTQVIMYELILHPLGVVAANEAVR